MNCQDFHDLIAIGVHGRLSDEQQGEIDRHRSVCVECAALHERFAGLMDLQAEALDAAGAVPAPDWNQSWEAIATRALPERGRLLWFLDRVPRWVPAMAAVLVVFVIGYVAGRDLFIDRDVARPDVAEVVPSDSSTSPHFASYADSLKPVLTSFLNRGDVVPPAQYQKLEREIVRDLLSRTRVLRGQAEASGDAELADLLTDLEFILTSLANLESGDKASAALLDRLIRDKAVSPRLREFALLATI